MTLADLFGWFDRPEPALSQLRADFANCSSFCRVLGKVHNQAVRKLRAGLVVVYVRHNHVERSCAIKLIDELSNFGIANIPRGFESAQRTDGPAAVLLLQPSPPFAPIVLLQQRGDEDAMNVLLHWLVLRWKLGRLTSEFRQRFVPCRCFTIFIRADDSAVQIESFGQQRAVSEPDAISSAELAAHSGDFQLKLPVVMPSPLDAGPISHLVFAEQSPCFIKVPTDTMKEAVFVRLFRCEHSVLVPSTNYPMPVAVPHRYPFTKLTASIIVLLGGGVHKTRISHHRRPHLPTTSNIVSLGKLHKNFSQEVEKSRGANSTRPHERHREAPLREARQAAPDWARASAALSSIENSRFSRGTEPLRRESYSVFVTSFQPASSIAVITIAEIRGRLQPRGENHPKSSDHALRLASLALEKIAAANSPALAVAPPPQHSQRSAATDSRDENLKAKAPGGGGLVKEERKPLNRSILDAPADATQSNLVSSRCHGGRSNDSPRSVL